MSKLDVYLRSIERFGAAGAVLTSGQAVLLRFPTGDRSATQVTPHDQLVMLVREVASPQALDQLDQGRPARFEIESAGFRYAIDVTPRAGVWQVAIEPAAGGAPAAAPATPRTQSRAASPVAIAVDPSEMAIERGQYDMPGSATAAPATSGSGLLDGLTSQARAARATDVYLSAGAPAFMRAAGELVAAGDRASIDGELLAREIGVVAPPEARAAWQDNRIATFAYGDAAGRVRVTLSRDHRGPAAALRVLPAEAPALDRLGLGADVGEWLGARGLIVVAGPSGAGKTTTLGALVRALADRKRRVVMLEDPIEIVHASPWISQRAVGDHVDSIASGVRSAMREAADAIVIGAVTTPDDAAAVIEALAGGHLVLTTVAAPSARLAVDRLVERLPADQRPQGRALCDELLLGILGAVVGRAGARTFEIVGRRP